MLTLRVVIDALPFLGCFVGGGIVGIFATCLICYRNYDKGYYDGLCEGMKH